MRVELAPARTGSTVATIRRPDGTVVELSGYDRKHRVPHDLAHLVTERELKMPGGVFGSIAGGAMFSSMRIVEGRQRHDAVERSSRVLKVNQDSLNTAELVIGIVHTAVERGEVRNVCADVRRAWASRNSDPFPWTDRQLTDAVSRLGELAATYARDGVVRFDWPDELRTDGSDAPGGKRARRGRR